MTRTLILCTVVALVSVTAAQAPSQGRPDPRSVRLRGDRFKPLTYDEMTPAQRTMIEHVLAGPRGSVDGPFNVQLRSPEMGDLGQQFGASTRFATSVPRKLYELAIIVTARHWTAQFEWVRASARRRAGGHQPGGRRRDRRRPPAKRHAA
jgi:hypothetical protein